MHCTGSLLDSTWSMFKSQTSNYFMTAVLLLNSSRYSGLSIKYVRGADPVIKLLDDADEVIEVRVPFVLRSSRSINLNFAIFLLNVDLGYRQVEHRLC